jgi:putative endonuclease
MELSRWRERCQSVARGALYRLIDRAQRWLGIGMYQPGELALGARGEAIAKRYLQRHGYRCLEASYRSWVGEIDLVMLDHRQLVFVEVKTWRAAGAGEGPADSVDQRKQWQLTRCAQEYLTRYRLWNQPARFDVVAIVLDPARRHPDSIRHYRGAFEASEDRRPP